MYAKTSTQEFGLTHQQVCDALNVTCPDGAALPGYVYYETREHAGEMDKDYVEAFPVNGVQVWSARTASTEVKGERLAQGKTRLKDAVTARRYALETGGVDVGGAMIKTDRESQGQLSCAFSSLTAGLIKSVDWKAANGWVTLDADGITILAGEVASHVQACFTAEKTHHEAIDALTLDQVATYDTTAGWPKN